MRYKLSNLVHLRNFLVFKMYNVSKNTLQASLQCSPGGVLIDIFSMPIIRQASVTKIAAHYEVGVGQ
ncbi:MAG: Unknown protein [uncultured Sulfurovum sp.]|uniref:Uncharacterized protein n=1 Tax=uncultured Sulfurovum sp. TaxID=269237 RepID=A0A6S6TSE7_9BACT|nr:MAG: Unknown protein [uncultured Sulfurovum sp.]